MWTRALLPECQSNVDFHSSHVDSSEGSAFSTAVTSACSSAGRPGARDVSKLSTARTVTPTLDDAEDRRGGTPPGSTHTACADIPHVRRDLARVADRNVGEAA